MKVILARKPNRELTPFEEMERMFDALWGGVPAERTDLGLALDVFEREGALHIHAAVPGLNKEQVKVAVEDGVLTISGETKQAWEANDDTKVYRREVRYGRFNRAIRLPENLNLEAIEARFVNGLIEVKIPMVEVKKPEPKVIEIKSSE